MHNKSEEINQKPARGFSKNEKKVSLKSPEQKILTAIQTTIKLGQEQFTFDNEKLPLNVLSFWQWSSSELSGNVLRGILAEFIVASTIDILETKILSEKVKTQKSITLSSLLKLNPLQLKYN